MEYKWLENLESNLLDFMSLLKKDEFSFYPVKKGITKDGADLNLGMSCYALKIYYMTGNWETLTQEERKKWGIYINSFQDSVQNFPSNSYIDKDYLKSFRNFTLLSKIKNLIKRFVNYFKKNSYLLEEEKLENYIRAETKQAISTLFQVGLENEKPYKNPYETPVEVYEYLNNLDWTKPWDAGAQFSAMCVFTITQNREGIGINPSIEELKKFAYSIVDTKTGAFFRGRKPNEKELINGAMKVITGLDWINENVPFPERLIDTCLDIEPYEEGCDIVDLVYVLYMCSKITSYRNEEVIEYLKKVLEKIEKHYFIDEGGFSYFTNMSQTTYYGVKTSKGENTPDIHGTVLLIWAISMISELVELPTSNWKVLKP
tara:strand:+ start:6766 stop:7884 length:1119 start_codon:yes stop_codon:yes gene_type:complete